MAVDLRVALVETLARFGQRVRRQLLREQAVERRAQLVALSGVAQVELAGEARRGRAHALGRKLVARLGFERAENVLGMIGGDLVERAQLGADVVVHHVGAEKAERRERAGARRHQNAPHAELFRHRGGMHGAGAAERQQRERRKIDPALGGEHAHLVGHAHVDDALDAGGGGEHVHLERIGDVGLERRARGRDVELLRAAEEIVRVEKAADEIGVGDGRPRAAAPVAGGSWIGAGALRPDIEEAAGVDPGDRAAARRDRGHVERGQVDLPAGDDAFGDFERHAAFDEGDVGEVPPMSRVTRPVFASRTRQIGARLRARGRAGE